MRHFAKVQKDSSWLVLRPLSRGVRYENFLKLGVHRWLDYFLHTFSLVHTSLKMSQGIFSNLLEIWLWDPGDSRVLQDGAFFHSLAYIPGKKTDWIFKKN